MKVNFGNFVKVGLTNPNGTKKSSILFDYANKKVIYQRVFHNNALIKTIYENGFTNYSPQSGKPLLIFFENALKRISHAFYEKTGEIKSIVKKDKQTKSSYYAKFNKNGKLKSVTIFEMDKNAFKSKYFLNENGDVIKIKRKKPDWNGNLAIKYNREADEIEFIQKDQRLNLSDGLFQKEETSFNNDFGGKLLKIVTKEFDNTGSITSETKKYAQKNTKPYMYEYMMSDNETLHPLIYETFDSSGHSTFLWCVETGHKSPQPQFFTIPAYNVGNKSIDISKIVPKDYYELISANNFLKNRIKYSYTMML